MNAQAMDQDTEKQEERSLADDLASAFDQLDAEGGDAVESGETEHDFEDVPDAPRDEPEPEGGPEGGREGQPGDEKQPEAKEAPASDPLDTPPRGLSAQEREAWKTTPKEIRQAIHRRSQDFERGIQKYRNEAQFGTQVKQALGRHQHLFNNGQHPLQLVDTLLSTASLLRNGTNSEKAKAVASIVSDYGIDVRALDAALVGHDIPGDVAQNDQLEQAINQRLAPIQQELQHYRAQQTRAQQEQQRGIHTTLQQFAADPANEFYRDVRMDMADIMELAGKRGINLSLKDAYDRACQMNPEIRKVIQQRNDQTLIRNKRPAASSVSGGPGGGSSGPAGDSVRDALEHAISSAGSRL